MISTWHCPPCEVGDHLVALIPPPCWACGEPMQQGDVQSEFGLRNLNAMREERARMRADAN